MITEASAVTPFGRLGLSLIGRKPEKPTLCTIDKGQNQKGCRLAAFHKETE